MKLFERIPDKLFSILSSPKKELYVDALFVLRQAFKGELIIKKEELVAMFLDSLEANLIQADFSEELDEFIIEKEEIEGLAAKASLLLRKLKETGWVEIEFEKDSFEENITIPDYGIKLINLLYELSSDEQKEYNSYVYATYSSIKSAGDNKDYLYQALNTAYRNTVQLIDELKALFNNIKRYHRRVSEEAELNALLTKHFDEYKTRIIDSVYYPLKTIDSVPRFKNTIIMMLNEWTMDENITREIIRQGMQRHIYKDEEQGRDDIFDKINYIVETYEGIDDLINNIDKKHTGYTKASIDRIRYMLNSDRSVKGKLIELLKHIDDEKVLNELTDGAEFYQHNFIDEYSLYSRAKRTVKTEGEPLKISDFDHDETQISGFLDDIKKIYSNKKVDAFVMECFRDKTSFTTEELNITTQDDFIMVMLGTMRGTDKAAEYKTEFKEEFVYSNGYRVPFVTFSRKDLKYV